MPEPTTSRRRHDPLALEATALRYAARDLSPNDTAEFEAQLADDQSARDALAEAVRLSAAALGQEPPAPHSSFRVMIRERLRPLRGWLARRAYRGHPFAWAGLGAGVVAAATLVGLNLAGAEHSPQSSDHADSRGTPELAPTPHQPADSEPIAPEPQPATSHDELNVAPADHSSAACTTDDNNRKAAEIWAELSTPEHVEKAVEDETRWRHRLKDLHMSNHNHPGRPAAGIDSRDP